MAQRFIFSQMFDIRPRNVLGELDLGKIRKIEALLDLKLVKPSQLTERIINLKSESKKTEALKSKDIFEDKAVVDGEESAGAESDALGRPLPLDAKVRLIEEFLETSLPNQAEILAIFEAIEEADRILKESGREERIEIKAVAPEILPDLLFPKEAGEEVKPVEEIFISPAEADLSENFFQPPAEKIYQTQADSFVIEQSEEAKIIRPRAVYEDLLPEQLISEKRIFDVKNLDWQLTPAQERFFSNRAKSTSSPQIIRALATPRRFRERKPMVAFLAAAFLIFSLAPALGWINRVLAVKNNVLDYSVEAYQALISAKDSLSQADFAKAQKNFETANYFFSRANSQVDQIGQGAIFVLENIPGLPFFSSRINLIKAGEELSKSGQNLTQLINLFGGGGEAALKENQSVSLLFVQGKNYLEGAIGSLVSANNYLQKVDASSFSPDIGGQLADLKNKLPEATKIAGSVLDWTDKFLNILGGQRSMKYLLVFQNNAEIRPTGGFIGSYGVLDLDQGNIKNILIDNVFNIDGQLTQMIVLPKPIQKISTAWSMHDSNWFADYPASAQKIASFYEKAGGPTVDGVISFTPTVVEKLLALTGPVELPQYNLTLNENNFIELTQYKVEIDYDKEQNQPKKILADFTPIFIEKLGEQISKKNFEVLKILNQLLKEKQILFYFDDSQLENFVKTQGWGGEILPAQQDYFSVVNTNINGFKTDKMIDETISHTSQISEDGSIIDTLAITRHHSGGNSKYDWYNRVNADYLRVYLPEGSKLIFASGQTKEDDRSPIDYEKSGFKTDPDVLAEEQSTKIDPASGTRISQESGKTVFGNWVYTSPGETTVLTYQYRLPFKLDTAKNDVSFSLLAQKQSGSLGSHFENNILFPKLWQATWAYPENSATAEDIIKLETDLSVDRLVGAVFKR